MEDFEQRVEAVKEKVGITNLDSNFIRSHGTVTCPFCGSRGKGWITNNAWFKCFKSSCGVSGDVITIHKLLNNLPSYGTALYSLEQEHGLTFKFRNIKYEERDTILNQVLDIYREQLDNNKEVFDYLLSRGISETSIRNLKIGYAPNQNRFLGSGSIEFSTLVQHKLINFKYRDFLTNRIVFPITNTENKLVHLSGRWYGKLWDQCPKYKDTPAVAHIGSSKQYLLFEEYLEKYKHRGDTIVLSEGIPDTIILNQEGVPSFGLLGLEKVVTHYNKLKDFKNIIAVFDNDQFEPDHSQYPNEFKSWVRIIPQLINLQCMLPVTNFYMFMVPENKDINDYYLNGHKDLKGIIDKTKQPFVETIIKQWGNDIGKHIELLKLISVTNKGKEDLSYYLDNSESALEYALRVFGG